MKKITTIKQLSSIIILSLATLCHAQNNVSQQLKIDLAKRQWQGFSISVSPSIYNTTWKMIGGKTEYRTPYLLEWQEKNFNEIPDYPRKEEKQSFSLGVNLDYTYVFPNEMTLGLQAGYHTVKNGTFDYYDAFLVENNLIIGDIPVPFNMRINNYKDFNIKVGKVLGEQSQFHIYGKIGMSLTNLEYDKFKTYMIYGVNKDNTFHSKKNHGALNYGAGIDYKLPYGFALGFQYNFTQVTVENTIDGSTELLVQKIYLKDQLSNHTVSFSASYNFR